MVIGKKNSLEIIRAVVAAMIATSGDESFVLLAIIPEEAIFLTLILFVIGVGAGALTDLLLKHHVLHFKDCNGFQIHDLEKCQCYPRGEILKQWKKHSPFRTTTFLLAILFIMIAADQIPIKKDWMQISILMLTAFAIFIISTVPDQFIIIATDRTVKYFNAHYCTLVNDDKMNIH